MTFAESSRTARAVLEVDEAWLPKTMDETHPRVLLLGNLSRDQLDRMNEVAMLARRWREMLARHTEVIVVANADDPMVAFAVGNHEHVVWVSAGQSWTSDSVVCAACGSLMTRSPEGWACSGCDRRQPASTWQLEYTPERKVAHGPNGLALDLSQLQLPGRFNAANATLALAAVAALGLSPEAGLARMNRVQSVSGRYATLRVGDLTIRLLLAKNPAGWSELLDIMPPAPTPVIVTINSDYADGRDPSWLWDVPFEKLHGRLVIATGFRRRDLAVRLKQAGVDHLVIEDPYHDADLPSSVRDLDVIDCAATYTAFFNLRTTGEPV